MQQGTSSMSHRKHRQTGGFFRVGRSRPRTHPAVLVQMAREANAHTNPERRRQRDLAVAAVVEAWMRARHSPAGKPSR